MHKSLLTIFLLTFLSVHSRAEQTSLKVTWFGSTCVALSDGKTAVLFDPFFTRPSLWKVVSFQSIKSDPQTVKNWLKKIDQSNLSALITSHSHYDHVLDLPEVAKTSGARVYGSESTKNIALGGGVLESRITTLSNGQNFKIGDFGFRVLGGEHPPHFLGITLASGQVMKPLKPGASAYAFKKDQDFTFLITHPAGNILFHPSGNTVLTKKEIGGFKAELVILGVANRKSSRKLLEKTVNAVQAKTIIPVHFDNIFTPLNQNPGDLFGVKMPEFYRSAARVSSGSKVKTLKIGETFELTNQL